MEKQKIAINMERGYKAIDAWVTTIEGCKVAVHRDPRRVTHWSVSDVATGLRVLGGKSCTTRPAALAAAKERILKHGVAAYKRAVENNPAAPDPKTVEPMEVKPPPPAVRMIDVKALAHKIARVVPGGLEEKEVEAVGRALSRLNGKLKSKCPSAYSDPMAAAAWQGLQPNTFKVTMGKTFVIRNLEDPAPRILFDKLFAINWPTVLDKDAEALKEMGVWP